GAAEDREVLREDRHLPAVHGAVSGDHSVPVRPGGGQAEVGGAVPGQRVQLHERARVEQHVDAFPGGPLAPGVLLLHRPGGAGVHRLLNAPVQVSELAGSGVDVGLDLAHLWMVSIQPRSATGKGGFATFAGIVGQVCWSWACCYWPEASECWRTWAANCSAHCATVPVPDTPVAGTLRVLPREPLAGAAVARGKPMPQRLDDHSSVR